VCNPISLKYKDANDTRTSAVADKPHDGSFYFAMQRAAVMRVIFPALRADALNDGGSSQAVELILGM